MTTTEENYKCDALVQIPNGHPEPDSPSDLYDIVECGAKVTLIYRDGNLAGHECEAGHYFISEEYKTDAERYEEYLADRQAEGYW